MGCVWLQRGGHWQARTIRGRPYADELPELSGIAVVPLKQGAALFTRKGVHVRVNGEPVLGGLRVLEHKDEVLVGSERLFYSAEVTPLVVTFRPDAGERIPVCPVCRGPVRDGMQAVECPGCGRWFHQRPVSGDQPAKPCWTYAPTCRFCNHPTPLDVSAAWKPGPEE